MTMKTDNPFYRNPLFKATDIERLVQNPISLWTKIRLIFHPMLCQISDGYVLCYKTDSHGRLYLFRCEPTPSVPENWERRETGARRR